MGNIGSGAARRKGKRKVVGTIEEVIRDMEADVFDFTINGECANCGQCCSNFLPVSKKEIKKIHRHIQKKKVAEQKHLVPAASQTVDWTCPFRDNSARRCTIYDVRPAICRDFRCDKPRKKIQADKSMYHGKYSVVDMRKEFFGGENNDQTKL